MHDLDHLDETLDLNQTASYHVSIQVKTDGFSFCILDLNRNKYVALRHYPLKKGDDPEEMAREMEGILQQDEFLGREFKSIYALFISPNYTLVPSPLFSKENLKLYFEFNQEMHELDEIHYSKLKKTDAYLVYSIHSSLANTLVRHFGNVRFYHQGFPLLETLLEEATQEATVSLCLHGSYLDIAVAEKKKLKVYNSFSYTNEQDMLFFILYIFEQLRLSQQETEVFLSGTVTPTPTQLQWLRRYLRKVRTHKPGALFTYSYTFGEKDEQRFVHLLNLFACV